MKLRPCFPMPEVYLCRTKHKYYKTCKKLGIEGSFLGTDAQMTYENGVAIVYVRPISDTDQENALLVHEAVHVVQMWLEELQEHEPGVEEMAYMVQAVSLSLFSANRKRSKKNG